MKNTYIVAVVVLVVVLVTALFLFGPASPTVENEVPLETTATDHKNATYVIDGTPVTLKDGVAETAIANSASKVVTRYFGNEVFKDLNDDDVDDVVFLLTQESGGSGTFFYVVAALATETGYVGSEALLLGDRIAPQSTESGTGKQVVINYAERAPGEPMTTPPSVGKTQRLLRDVESRQFGEVAADFEGEADPERMTLTMKTWVWQKAEFNDGRTVVSAKPDAFALTFKEDGSLMVRTDCNNAGGQYATDGTVITFTDMATTLMYCEGSQESEFLQLLSDTSAFHFTNRGELILDLKFDSGTVTFR